MLADVHAPNAPSLSAMRHSAEAPTFMGEYVPREIRGFIFSNLSGRDSVRLGSTCRTLYGDMQRDAPQRVAFGREIRRAERGGHARAFQESIADAARAPAGTVHAEDWRSALAAVQAQRDQRTRAQTIAVMAAHAGSAPPDVLSNTAALVPKLGIHHNKVLAIAGFKKTFSQLDPVNVTRLVDIFLRLYKDRQVSAAGCVIANHLPRIAPKRLKKIMLQIFSIRSQSTLANVLTHLGPNVRVLTNDLRAALVTSALNRFTDATPFMRFLSSTTPQLDAFTAAERGQLFGHALDLCRKAGTDHLLGLWMCAKFRMVPEKVRPELAQVILASLEPIVMHEVHALLQRAVLIENPEQRRAVETRLQQLVARHTLPGAVAVPI